MRSLIYILFLSTFTANAQERNVDMLQVSIDQQNCFTTGNIVAKGNAGSECSGNADSTTGWVPGSGAVLSSIYVDGIGYVIQGVRSPNASSRLYFLQTVENGASYEVTYTYRMLEYYQGGCGAYNWQGVTTSPSVAYNIDGQWHTITHNVTTTSTTLETRYYIASSSTGSGHNILQIRDLKIVKI